EPQEDDPRSLFFGRGFTLHANTWTKTRTAERHGAAAVLVATEPTNPHRSAPRPPERANAPAQALRNSELGIPRFSVSSAIANALFAASGRTAAEWQAAIDRGASPASRALTGVRVRLRAANQAPAPARSWNVAGLWRGS